jgi:putative SOS response-associated peptidase YedK
MSYHIERHGQMRPVPLEGITDHGNRRTVAGTTRQRSRCWAPGADVAPYHNRQVVVIRPEDCSAWICLMDAST